MQKLRYYISYIYNYFRKVNLSHIDLPLLSMILLLLLYSLLVLYSAGGGSFVLVNKQLYRIMLGFFTLLTCAMLPLRYYYRATTLVYSSGLLLLLLVLMIGYTSKGAQRWIDLKFMRFQPSEIMKIIVPMMTAYYLSKKTCPPSHKDLFIALCITLIPGALIAKQPDLGTSILVVSSGLTVIFFAGISYRIIALSLSMILISLPFAWKIMHSYQRERVLTLLDPERDPLGKGYHIIQSKIAIGSGGIFGKGWQLGTQSQLEFLPERTTDFIFAVLAEEFGLIGVLLLLTIYVIVVLRGIYIANRINDCFARLFCISLVLTFMIYLFVNIGMVTGILPVVGVPLPLFSYGGTSMLTIMASLGIVFSLSKKSY